MSPIVPDDEPVIDDDPFGDLGSVADQTREWTSKIKIVTPSATRTEKSESDITKQAITWLKAQPRTYAWKLHTGAMGENGHPDIDGCMNGRTLKIEMKRPGRRPTPAQMARLLLWRQAGAIVGWATTVDEVMALVEQGIRDPSWRNPLTGPGVGAESARP